MIPPDLELTDAKIVLMSLDSRIIPNNKAGRDEINYWFKVLMNHEYCNFAVEGNARFEFYLN